MEETLTKLVITVPAAAAVIVTVCLFLRAQKTYQEAYGKLTKEVTDRFAACHKEYSEAVKESRASVTENTKVLSRLSTLIETMIRQTGGEG
jgi:hypothetical protein